MNLVIRSFIISTLFLVSGTAPVSLYGQEKVPQGSGPFGFVTTKDGKYAYVCFEGSEDVFKISLSDLTVAASAPDLSNFFPLQSFYIALNASESKVFVQARARQKLLVLDSQTLTVIHVIDDFNTIGFFRSSHSSSIISWDGGATVKIVDTETYAVREFRDDSLRFKKIRESKTNSNIWYLVGDGPGIEGYKAGVYDHVMKTWNQAIYLPLQSKSESIFDLLALPNEKKLYVATFGGWFPDFHAYGWLYSIDIDGGKAKVVPIDGGAMCLGVSPDNKNVIVGTGWPYPIDENNLLLVDANADSITGQIKLDRIAPWAYSQVNDLKFNPVNPHLLYATSADANAFFSIDINTRSLVRSLRLDRRTLLPHYFARRPGVGAGLVLIHRSPFAFELDIDKGIIKNSVKLPAIRTDVFAYDAVFCGNGRLLVPQGESVLEVDANDFHFIGNHSLPGDVSCWHSTLSQDQRRMYFIGQSLKYQNHFMAISTTSYQTECAIKLEGGIFNYRPFELPGDTKLYVLGGQQNGTVVIHVIGTNPFTVLKTITFSEPGSLGISAGPYYPFAYNSVSHLLFVGANQVVLAIDTETDTITKVIYLKDVASAIGIETGQLTYTNAIGLMYRQEEDYLYIAHLDRSFISIFDLGNDKFLPKVIPLKGFPPQYVFCNDDCSKMYTLNGNSDNISVIDTYSKTVEKVIELSKYISTSVQNTPGSPTEFTLSQNYPNPFNPATTIRYALPNSSKAKLTIYNLLGEKVATLVDEEQSTGWKEVKWYATGFPSGIYFYRLQAGEFIETKKMILLH